MQVYVMYNMIEQVCFTVSDNCRFRENAAEVIGVLLLFFIHCVLLTEVLYDGL